MTLDKLTVTVLGTGIMGSAMARNIARGGARTRVWNRTVERARPLAEDGIEVVEDLGEAVAGADIVVTMLFDGATVAEVMERAVPAMVPGTVWVQCTTVGIDAVAPLADLAAGHGVLFYDSPVSGTRGPAEAGTLVVMCAGPEEGRERVAPVLDAVGSRTVWTGDDGTAGTSTRLKLVVNSWVTAVSNSAGEATALSEGLGLDPALFLEVLAGGPLDPPFLRAKARLVRERAFSPAQFGVDTSGKDARLIVAAARSTGLRLDGAEAFSARLDRVAAAGHASEDMSAAYLASFPDTVAPPTSQDRS